MKTKQKKLIHVIRTKLKRSKVKCFVNLKKYIK